MSDRFPSKQITLDSYTFQLHGITSDDHYWNGIQSDFEPEFQRLCRRLVQPDYVCFDIGANIGIKTLFLSRHCPQGRVIAVEAGKVVAECLATNIAANDARNASWHHAAVAGHDGTITFSEASAWGHQAEGGASVEAVTLDTLVARHELTRLDFIKIDIEGGEFPVLKSSIELINRFDSLVYVELNSLTLLVWGNTNPRKFLEWIGANFSYVYALNRSDPSAELLAPVIFTDECRAILHRNLVDDGCVTDLIMSNAKHRFTPLLAYLEQQNQRQRTFLAQAQAERDALDARLVQAQAERDALDARLVQAQAERDAILASSSWRLSAPLRWLKQTMALPAK